MHAEVGHKQNSLTPTWKKCGSHWPLASTVYGSQAKKEDSTRL